MLMDAHATFADGLAFSGTPTDVDTDAVRPGPGNAIRIFVNGSSDLDSTSVILSDSADGTTFSALETIPWSVAEGLLEFTVPSNSLRYLRVALATPTVGTWSSAVSLCGVQTNR